MPTPGELQAAQAEAVENAIRADMEAAAASDDARRKARLSGLRCSCCDEPLPRDHLGDECADCANIDP